jgi:hypothetical protein
MEIENTNVVEMESADQYDAFLDGWDDDSSPVAEEADQPAMETENEASEEVTEEVAAEEEGNADEAEESEATETEAEKEAAPKTEQEAPSWNIKHMGEERRLTPADITPALLQKGMDYDRIRSKYDEAKPVVELMTQFANKAGMSVTDYIRHIRTEAFKAGGMSEAEAKRSVELEDRETAVAAAEAAQKEKADAEAESKAKINADIAEFAKAFPDVYKQAEKDPKVIPESVWAKVNSGELTLTAAYSRYAVEQAKAEAAAAKQAAAVEAKNAKNAARSTGSMKSAGNDAKNTDAFLEGWNS